MIGLYITSAVLDNFSRAWSAQASTFSSQISLANRSLNFQEADSLFAQQQIFLNLSSSLQQLSNTFNITSSVILLCLFLLSLVFYWAILPYGASLWILNRMNKDKKFNKRTLRFYKKWRFMFFNKNLERVIQGYLRKTERSYFKLDYMYNKILKNMDNIFGSNNFYSRYYSLKNNQINKEIS
ncbi:hypothetical protein [[Mycoplasma] testudinis]|uniref:hypothetical protein n=1 Tax=[Mycoplasma] testudinis TaxID=33924 RepID=UPI000A627431|nr:hypothetical protein [[Mycoplasma] testudinis]